MKLSDLSLDELITLLKEREDYLLNSDKGAPTILIKGIVREEVIPAIKIEIANKVCKH